MKSPEFRKVMRWARCNVCMKRKWIFRNDGWWCDGRCQDCADNYDTMGDPEGFED